MDKKPKVNISKLLKKYKSGKNIGSTNRARLVARGLVARHCFQQRALNRNLNYTAALSSITDTL